jgi:hypothetical protein
MADDAVTERLSSVLENREDVAACRAMKFSYKVRGWIYFNVVRIHYCGTWVSCTRYNESWRRFWEEGTLARDVKSNHCNMDS